MFPLLFLKSRQSSDGGGGAPFDATADATLLCEEGDYAESGGNGTFTAAVGSNLTHASLAPPAAAGAPNFNGTTNQLTGALPAAYGITGDAFLGLIAYTIDSAPSAGGHFYTDAGFWGDATDGYMGVAVGDNGDGTVTLTFGITCTSAAEKNATCIVTASGRHTVHWKYEWDGVSAGSICIGVDGSWGTPVALTSPLDPAVNGHVIHFGKNYNGSKRLDGREHSIGFYDVVKDDAFVAGWIGAYG